MVHLTATPAAVLHSQISDALGLERTAFGAKVRAARAILGLGQKEFAGRVGLTQRSVHRIEKGSVEPKLRTMLTIEQFCFASGIVFDDLPDGGFRIVVRADNLQSR